MHCLFITALLLVIQGASAQYSESDFAKAKLYFKQAKKAADKDGGKLWSHNLYGPIIFIDPKTIEAIANESDSAETFKKQRGIFSGKVPTNFGVANTAQNWGGKVWTVVRWPLPENVHQQQNLLMHELYHQLQKRTKLPKTDANCGHLDKFEGRLLLKLELEALRKVLTDYPRFLQKDLQAALTIRASRYQTFPDADSLERSLEQNEGLAEFTGAMLSGRSREEIRGHLISSIDEFYKKQSFVRSMAYITGPIYGFVLSYKNNNWNKVFLNPNVNFSNLSLQTIVAETYQLIALNDTKAFINEIAQSERYNYRAVYAVEKLREDNRVQIMSENKKKFIDGPVVILPNARMNFVFNPNEVQMIDDYGPVYPTFTGNADWGNLTVTKGGAFIKDWMYVYVPLPKNFSSDTNVIDGGGWQLKLKKGWKIKEGKRKGDYEVVKSD